MSDDATASQEAQLARLVAVYPIADELGDRFARHGHELYLVGGTVRDTLLRGPGAQDLDFATSARPDETQRIVAGWADAVWLTGARFGTISARKAEYQLEITTFRSDAYLSGSRHPQVTYGDSIQEDLSRRDFTINAMAVRVPDHVFVDPHGGLSDLAEGALRTPSDPETSFGDDPLRMVRLARFAAVIDVRPDDEVAKAAAAMAERLDEISRERIRDELDKLIVGAHVARGVDLLVDTGLADRFLPEVAALRMQHDPVHHHKDVYKHSLAVVERCPADDRVLRLAALLHDIGKPATRQFHEGGKVSFHHHEVVGARMARARLSELRYPKDEIEAICHLIALHLRFHGYADEPWTDSGVRRYVRDAGDDTALRRLNRLTRADVTTRNRRKAQRLQEAMDDLEARIAGLREQEALEAIRPPLDGNQIMRHLGLDPGPAVGRARDMLLEARLDRGPISEEEAYALLDAWEASGGADSQ